MKTRGLSIVAFFVMAIALSAACGSTVDVPTSTSSSGSGGSAGCSGNGPSCAQSCGSDAFEQPICQNGAWVCPPGTVDENDCPASTCSGPPLPCEVCNDGWACAPDKACIGSCDAFVCATCAGAPEGTITVGACACSCNGGDYGCALAPGCCNKDLDCGDETLSPCVNNVCKTPVMGACWADIECGAAMKCQGAIVCPCGSVCKAPDSPGTCVPG
jgi:hypothetical protein